MGCLGVSGVAYGITMVQCLQVNLPSTVHNFRSPITMITHIHLLNQNRLSSAPMKKPQRIEFCFFASILNSRKVCAILGAHAKD